MTHLRKAYGDTRPRGIFGSVKWFIAGIGALATSAIVAILVLPTAAGAFTVCGGPITSLSPNHGPTGTKVTIKGSNFLKGGTSRVDWQLNGNSKGEDTNPAIKNATIIAVVPTDSTTGVLAPGRYSVVVEGYCSNAQTTWMKQFLVTN